METKKETTGINAPTVSSKDAKALEKYLYYSRYESNMNELLEEIDDYAFPINRKALKEAKKYIESNSLVGNQDRETSTNLLDDFISLSKKKKHKYNQITLIPSENILPLIDKHPFNFNQLGATSTDIVKELYKDSTTLELSYNKIDIRLLAYYSQDKNLRDIIVNCDKYNLDFYSMVASEIFGVQYVECLEFINTTTPQPEGKKRRYQVKELLLRTIYQGYPITYLGNTAWASEEEFKNQLTIFYKKFPKVISWVKKMKQYNRAYICDIFGNCRLFKSSLSGAIPQLFRLTETSIHKLFLKSMQRLWGAQSHRDWDLNIRIPLINCFIVDTTNKGECIKFLQEAFQYRIPSDLTLKLDIE